MITIEEDEMNTQDKIQREILPIPDIPHVGLTTYDAKDPDTKYPLIVPDKPFFMYFAPGATHAPHHVPVEWSDRYKGKFNQRWNKHREEIFTHQKQLGVI